MLQRYLIILFLFILPLSSADKKVSFYLDTLHTTHYLLDEPGQNEGWGANVYGLEFPVSQNIDERMILGSTINSQFNRCFIIGMHDDLYTNENLTFEASYMYVGEFFFDEFSQCDDDGIYSEVKKAVSIGFVPVLYYGLEYNIYETVGLEIGWILPGILVLGVQVHY